MKNINIINIKEVKEFIERNDVIDFDGFHHKFTQDRLLLIGWGDKIEIKLDIDFSEYNFLDFFNIVFKQLIKELETFSKREKFWLYS